MSDEPRSTEQDEDPEVEAHRKTLRPDQDDGEPEVEAHSMRPGPAEMKGAKRPRAGGDESDEERGRP